MKTDKGNQAIRKRNNVGGDLEGSQNGGRETVSNDAVIVLILRPRPVVKEAQT